MTEQSPETGIADAFSQLSDQTASLVRREIEAAQKETLDKLKQSAPGAAMLAMAATMGVLSAASAYRWTLRLLEKRLGPASAALVATAGYGAVAGYLVVEGVRRLRAAPKPLPTDTARQAGSRVEDTVSRVRTDPGTR